MGLTVFVILALAPFLFSPAFCGASKTLNQDVKLSVWMKGTLGRNTTVAIREKTGNTTVSFDETQRLTLRLLNATSQVLTRVILGKRTSF
jgi:hypothetical protein